MSLILNNKNISKVYLGETPIIKMYRGNTLVYQLDDESDETNAYYCFISNADMTDDFEVRFTSYSYGTTSSTDGEWNLKGPFKANVKYYQKTPPTYTAKSDDHPRIEINKSNTICYFKILPKFNELLTNVTRGKSIINSPNWGSVETTIDLTELDTSNITNMSEMFYFISNNVYFYEHKPCHIILGDNFNTSKVTDMGSMFYGCKSLTSLDVSHFVTSKVETMYNMFRECKTLTSLDVSHFDTSQVTDMFYMFYGCNSLTSLDVSNFNTSKVTDMSEIFGWCSDITEIKGLNNWNTSKVTTFCGSTDAVPNTLGLFVNCHKLKQLDLSKWDTSSVTNISSLVSNCTDLESIDLSGWDTTKVTYASYMFGGYVSSTTYSEPKLKNIIFGPSWGKNTASLTLDLSYTNSNNNYQYTDETWNSMLTMYDRAANGLTNSMTLKFNSSSNFPDGWVDAMTAKGYTIATA